MFQIISDSGCDFTKEESQKYNVDIVPFYVSFDQSTHLKEGVDISKEEFFNKLVEETKLFPKTSQPSPQDYIDILTPHLDAGKDILILTISSKLSGSYSSATLAAEILAQEYSQTRTITIIDSLNGSIGQGLILREIIKMRDAGLSLSEVVTYADKILKSTRVYVTLDSLEYAKRGGRIGTTTAFVGNILKLRPILHVKEGRVLELDNVRGKKKALRLMEESLLNVLSDVKNNVSLAIGHILSEEDSAGFKSCLESSLNIKIDNPITHIGATIGAHAGPGALAIAYCKKYKFV